MGLRPLGSGALGWGDRVREGVPAYPSPHLLCPQRVSLAPQIGPVVVAKRHRSSVAPHNTVSRDSSVPWAGMGCEGNAETFSSTGLWVLWGLGVLSCPQVLRVLCPAACIPLVPVGTASLLCWTSAL